MNLFRSEEHVRDWLRFDPAAEQGILPLDELVSLFSMNFFRRRMDEDYISRSSEYIKELFSAIGSLGEKLPFWSLEPK